MYSIVLLNIHSQGACVAVVSLQEVWFDVVMESLSESVAALNVHADI